MINQADKLYGIYFFVWVRFFCGQNNGL